MTQLDDPTPIMEIDKIVKWLQSNIVGLVNATIFVTIIHGKVSNITIPNVTLTAAQITSIQTKFPNLTSTS